MSYKHSRVIIIGSGPAGYSAAIYLARAQLTPLVFAGEQSGGQLMLTTEVENYPGFPQGIMGPQLMHNMRSQAEHFGATIIDKHVARVDFSSLPFKVTTQSNNQDIVHTADAIVLATGAQALQIGVKGELEYSGRGVSYCAVCDAAFFKDKRVFVVGGGDSAMEDTLALTKFANKITILHRRDSFKASKIMQERVLVDHKDKVDVWWNSQVIEVKGNGQIIQSLIIKRNGKTEAHNTQGLFVAIGHRPATDFLKGQVELNDKGYVKTGITYPSIYQPTNSDSQLWTHSFPTMTSVDGVFAGGDNVDFRYRQAVTAAGLGVQAALDAERYLERR